MWLQHIWALEGEREARGQEATEASQRHAKALEQVKLRDMAAADLQKKVHIFLPITWHALYLFLLSLVANPNAQDVDSRPSCEACLCRAEFVYDVNPVSLATANANALHLDFVNGV